MTLLPYEYMIASRDAKNMRRTLHKNDSGLSKDHVNFSSNDYLRLSKSQELIQAGYEFALQYGAGAGASRFVSGNNKAFFEIEEKLARFKKREAAFFAPSGYQLNVAVISALTNPEIFEQTPLVLFDKLNHASMYAALKLSGIQPVRYRHNDLNHLEELLKKYAKPKQQIFMITESVFSMDGDVTDLTEWIKIVQNYEAFSIIDDAHAMGILGLNGAGLACDYPEIDVITGTASKALGLQGGYIACSQKIMDYLYNYAEGFIYSTAVSPFLWGGLNRVLDMLPEMDSERSVVTDLSNYLRQNLQEIGIDTGQSTMHIVPAIIGSNDDTLRAESHLNKNGFFVKAIRPPTVPPNSARLRLTVNPFITKKNIDELCHYLKEIL